MIKVDEVGPPQRFSKPTCSSFGWASLKVRHTYAAADGSVSGSATEKFGDALSRRFASGS